MKSIPFIKMQGAGNDFIVIDHNPNLDYVTFAKKVCHRHLGIGADGLLVLDESTTCDYKMRIINADGSEAEMCGNGARCMAVYIKHKFAVVLERFTMETLSGPISAEVEGEMATVQLSDPLGYRKNIDLDVAGQNLTVHFINTGVPHVIVFVQGLQEFDVEGLGRVIREHKEFKPSGTNVNFIECVKEGWVSIRTYERGVEAETLACGTGSTAAALVGYLHTQKKLVSQKEAAMKVVTKSGEILEVTFDMEVQEEKEPVISNVWLKGSGTFIAKGEYYV